MNCPTEEQEQMAFVDWLKIKRIPHFHCPNEVGGQTKALKIRAIKMKRLGVARGVPDLFVFVPIKGVTGEVDSYQPLAIEMKRRKYSTTSKEQKEWLEILELAGIPCKVCKGADEAIAFVNEYLKPEDFGV